MKILVTGGTGFLGTAMVHKLLAEGHHIILAVRNVEKAKLEFRDAKLTIIQFDFKAIDYKLDLYQYFHRPDSLLHLAWSGLPNYKSINHIIDNIPYQCLFLNNLISNGLCDCNITGSCLEYGLQEGELDVAIETNPTTPYGQAKVAIYKYVATLQERYSFKLKWMRLFYVYSVNQGERSLYGQMNRAIINSDKVFNMSGGQQWRDFSSLEEMVEMIYIGIKKDSKHALVNCCSGIKTKVEDFVRNYFESENYKIELNLGYYPYPDYEPMAFWGRKENI
ncbi:MAG TPA: NAD-dependent epimerase/dehydratase family protein [Saprospiraceae bacterium]|nr:NAD-dependent epimerase/dehydratase family protein [Saprospiraceae bacterium]